jgi:glycosyltransferase involved in cell wall biosynthesis
MAPAPAFLWIGTYESDYPRTRVLVAGLREIGARVDECHSPVWELTRHKAGDFLSPRRAPATLWRFVRAWASVLRRVRRHPAPDAFVAGYPSQLDAPPAWLVARLRRRPLVVDAMISLTDTLTGDRARATGAAGLALRALDWVALRAADLVMTDTASHADFFAERFGVPRDRLAVVPVGAEDEIFQPAPPPTGAPHVLFYGKLAPLHGIATVLEAARRPGVPPLRVIGEGQLEGWLDGELARDSPPGLERVPWIPYEELGTAIAAAAICLGIFGESEKARRVVPNKVFQAMAVGRPIVTADTPAIREVLENERDALLVPAADPDALAAALRRLADDPTLRQRLGAAARQRYLEIATPARVAGRLVVALADVAAVR